MFMFCLDISFKAFKSDLAGWDSHHGRYKANYLAICVLDAYTILQTVQLIQS